MRHLLWVRIVAPFTFVAACSATAPLPDSGEGAAGGNQAGAGGTASNAAGADGNPSAAGTTGAAGQTSGDGGQGNGGQTGTAGKAGASGGGATGKSGSAGQSAGNAGDAGASSTEGGGGEGGTSASSESGGGGASGGASPFGGGGSENGGFGGACDLAYVAPGDGLACTSLNYIVGGDSCDGCGRGPIVYFCEGSGAPPSKGCSTLPEQGPGYFCCDESVCTPQPGGCGTDVRYHCPPETKPKSGCTKLGGDETSFCCPS
jgi:hypothetical protein